MGTLHIKVCLMELEVARSHLELSMFLGFERNTKENRSSNYVPKDKKCTFQSFIKNWTTSIDNLFSVTSRLTLRLNLLGFSWH